MRRRLDGSGLSPDRFLIMLRVRDGKGDDNLEPRAAVANYPAYRQS